jgi:hypothetical protein
LTNLWIEGKVQARPPRRHAPRAFHQAEVFWLGNHGEVVPAGSGLVLQSVDAITPGSTVRIVPTKYAMCSQA